MAVRMPPPFRGLPLVARLYIAGLLALVPAGQPIGMMAMLGLIVLAGV